MSELNSIFDSKRRQNFRRQVRLWYQSHKRELPWRRIHDPYAVWISEIMLQQTVVAAVIPYFEKFMQRFPDVHVLADSDESEVLHHWEGLGYYSRARNIHKTAKIIAVEFQGKFPTQGDALQELPGIGRYTAGAICSFAYDQPAPIVEANTLRLYSRLIGLEEDPRSKSGQNQLWEFAELILPRKSPGIFNQAMMDLGSLVCTPQNPDCAACPVSSGCEAFLHQRQHQIPVPKKRPEITPLTAVCIAIFDDGNVMIRQRKLGELWAGLWDFPRFTLDNMDGVPHPAILKKKLKVPGLLYAPPQSSNGKGGFPVGISPAIVSDLERNIREQAGVDASVQHFVTEIRHSVTRYKIRLLCFVAKVEPVSSNQNNCTNQKHQGQSEYQWVTVSELKNYPLSVTGRKFARLLPEEALHSG